MLGKFTTVLLLVGIIACFAQDTPTTDEQTSPDLQIDDTVTIVGDQSKIGGRLRVSENATEFNGTDVIQEVVASIQQPIADTIATISNWVKGEEGNSTKTNYTAEAENADSDPDDTLVIMTTDEAKMMADFMQELEDAFDEMLDDMIADEPVQTGGFLRASRTVQSGNVTDDNSTIIDSIQSVIISIQEPLSNQLNLIVSWVSGDALPENATDAAANETVQDDRNDKLDDGERGLMDDLQIDMHATDGITIVLDEPIVLDEVKPAEDHHHQEEHVVVSISMEQIQEAIAGNNENKKADEAKPFFARLLDLFGAGEENIDIVAENLTADGKEEKPAKREFYDGL